MLRQFSAVLLGALVIGSGSSGCSSQPVSAEDEATTDLREIARAYEVVIAASNRPPRELEQIKKVLTDLHTDGLVTDDPEDVLISPRDGQPYVIIMGAAAGDENPKDILAYESKGAGGVRYVLLMSHDVRQMTVDEFNQATFATGHEPAGG